MKQKTIILFLLVGLLVIFGCAGQGGSSSRPELKLEFEADYNHNNTNSYLTVYGWTRSPLVEYYIVENFGSYRPPGIAPRGTVTIDGGVYDIYMNTRVGPTIAGPGDREFRQYYGVRRNDGRRSSGTVSISEHFKAWEEAGMRLGSLIEVALCVEAYAHHTRHNNPNEIEHASGNANVRKNILYVDGEPLPSGGGTNPSPIVNNTQGQRFNGYFYEFWADANRNATGGTMNLTSTGNGGTFECSWDSRLATRQNARAQGHTNTDGRAHYNILFRMGHRF